MALDERQWLKRFLATLRAAHDDDDEDELFFRLDSICPTVPAMLKQKS